jgi:1,4-alpha-glucan branching enzyme
VTVPQPPESTGRVQPHVPATFLSGPANSQQDSDRWGWTLAAMTGPMAAPPGDATKWTGPPVRLPQGPRSPLPVRPRRTGRQAGPARTAARPAGPAARPARTAGSTSPVDPALETTGASGDSQRVRTPPALDAEDRRRLLEGTHDDPHAHLGAHVTPQGGVSFRTLRPDARAVTVVAVTADGGDGGELRAGLRDEGDGFFAGEVTVPGGEIPEYELLVRYGKRPGEDEVRAPDPYGFPPALGEFDLRLIRGGRHGQLWRALGARAMAHRGVSGTRFTVWAPNARGVRVAGDFNHWDGTGHPMRSLGSSGVWELFLPGVGDGAVYKFEVVRDDGSHVLHADPMARECEVPPADGSVVHTSTYRWSDGDWTDRRAASRPHDAPLSVYELHLPSWRPGLTCSELAAQLPAYVRDLGFTHVQLMPCAEPSHFYAPTARLGSPDDLKHVIDALHRAGIGVIMDWVPARLPKDEWSPARSAGSSPYEQPEVRNFLVANALYWCQEFHLDGLHIGSVTEMLRDSGTGDGNARSANSPDSAANPDAVALLQEVNAAVHRHCPGVLTTAEETTAWDGITRATHQEGESGFGGLGFSFTWNTGWLHDTLSYATREPAQRTYHQEQLTSSMARAYAESYILPVPHGEVAHGRRSLVTRMPGDWWQQRANHRACLAFMWAHPGKQLLFMGQEFAQRTEWSQERGPDWWLLDPSYAAGADHRGVRELVRDLNTEYVRNASLWQQDTHPEGFSWVEDGGSGPAAAAGESVFAFLRFDAKGAPLLAVSNFSPERRPGHRLGVPRAHTGWREVLNTDEERYGGSGAGNPAPLHAEEHPAHGRPASITLTLPPLATIWLCPVSSQSPVSSRSSSS